MEFSPSLAAWSFTVPVDFRLARRRIRYSHHLLVRIRDSNEEGWGAAPLYARHPHQLPALLSRAGKVLVSALDRDAGDSRQAVAAQLVGTPDILSALDGALWDLEGRRTGRSVADLLGARADSVEITQQLFVAGEATAVEQVRKIQSDGTRRLKVKLSGDGDRDIRRVAVLRERAPEMAIRVDVNRGYSFSQAEAVAERLADLGVTHWEEPLEGSFDELAELRRRTPLPVILDESVCSRDELARAIEAKAVDILNIKLGRLGGITAASRYRDDCTAGGIGISIGCAEDVGPAMAAVLHLSAAWQPIETEGLGWTRLGVDLGRPSPAIVDGEVLIENAAGWGLSFDEDLLGASVGRSGAVLNPHYDWTLSFRAQSWLHKQRQRLGNALIRAGLSR